MTQVKPPDASLTVTEQGGRITLTAVWGDPAKPFQVPFVLSPQAAFHLGNDLRTRAEDIGAKKASYPASTGRVPVSPNRPGAAGPQSSVDGASPSPTQKPATPPTDLVGDDFPATP